MACGVPRPLQVTLFEIGLNIGHTVGIGSLAGALAVTEGRPVVRVLVNEQTASIRDVFHENAVVEPTRFRNVHNANRLTNTDVGGAARHLG